MLFFTFDRTTEIGDIIVYKHEHAKSTAVVEGSNPESLSMIESQSDCSLTTSACHDIQKPQPKIHGKYNTSQRKPI